MTNERIVSSIDRMDVLNYWLDFYPELDNSSELEDILHRVSGSSINEFVERFMQEESVALRPQFNYKIHQYLESMDCDLNNYVPFYHFFTPIINHKFDFFYSYISNCNIIQNTPLFIKEATKYVLNQMFEISFRTLILDVHVSKERGMLFGESAEGRFDYYCTNLLKNLEQIDAIYRENHVLTSKLCEIVDNYFNYVIEIVRKTKKNLKSITESINNGQDLGYIESIQTGLGDTHKGGKAVSVIYFTHGKVVYKPRSLNLDLSFQKMVSSLDDLGITDLGSIRLYTTSSDGWMEFIDYKECCNVEEVKSFYCRVGQSMALLYALNAKDFHYENLIAHGSSPRLIDLESLFHAEIAPPEVHDKSYTKALRILEHSVQSTGLLPMSLHQEVDGKDVSLDVGGIGFDKDQLSPFKSLMIENGSSDDIRVTRKNGILKIESNMPKLNGENVKSEKYVHSIKEGFESVYIWIMEHKEEFIKMVNNLFQKLQSRYIHRPTFLYGQLLRIANHPDILQSFVHLEVLLHRIGVHATDDSQLILKAELEDLLRLDIPYFLANVNQTSLFDSQGREIPDVLRRSPMEDFMEKLRSFSRIDLSKQLEFVDMAFLNRKTKEQDMTELPFSTVYHNKLTPEKWLHRAVEIGEYITSQSIYDQESEKPSSFWVGPSLVGIEENIWSPNILNFDLYSGNSGIALFLGYLGEITQRKDFKEAAYRAIQPVKEFFKEAMVKRQPFLNGAHTGLSGFLYSLDKLSGIWGDYDLEKFVDSRIDFWDDLAPSDEVLDFVGGSTGSMAVALSLCERRTDEDIKQRMIELAINNYDHLTSRAKLTPEGLSWKKSPLPAYVGFSHGVASMIAYLYKLYRITKREDIYENMKLALAFERSHFSTRHNNWFDCEKKDGVSYAWCHGAPGILLSKLMLQDSGYKDELLEREIQIGIDITKSKGFGNNPTYCHGDLGSLSILEYGAKVLGDSELKNQCYSTYQSLFEEVLSKSNLKERFRHAHSYSLMIGLSGFGYSMLQHYAPDDVPDFLRLQ
ncbi:type 2 lanthipeptide synthetase LanM family protein [Baia soyae]|uniref:Type 2 lantibiotic biosynthesis protein LanM n=1 Tax=Baia soyae TaxID=1544746 RepID=A0A4R2SFS9_9BACL|nr:type 2 lanthipeptide synthetase LanM family protein [Baia soyae]TCP70222.1 type 2 lantibiotic biosynthesis protein LanM [Baia soyae]